MVTFELTGTTVEVDHFQFVVGYTMADHVHACSNTPHVWANKKHLKVIQASTPERKSQALSDVIASAPQRSLPLYVVDRARELLQPLQPYPPADSGSDLTP